ncbi:MAG: Ig-like domain-containing protein, partial [Akkermansiaceae bacterium]|nr:Ig-like domain-containing protein [Akkermansiaceae bacterium]
ADENSFSLIGIGNKSLWLGFRTAHTGVVTLNVSNGQFDFEVVVFEGSEKGQLKVVSHSMRNGGFDRTLSFLSKPNTEYRVVLDTFLTNPIRWEVDYTLGPPNDLFADSIPLSGDLFTVTGYNRGASSELFERFRPHATRGRGKSVWWKWTAPFSGNFTINTSGSAFDTVLAVYTGDSAQSLTEVAANDDRLPLDYSSQVSFSAVEGTLYHIAVDSCHENVFGEIALNGFRSNTLQIIRQPRNLSAAIGRRAVFDVSALSATWVRYQWFFNGQAIPGQTAANLIIDPVRESDLGNYHVEIRNNENFAVSDTATLTEAEVAPSLTWSSGNSAVAAGTAVTLSATFSGSAPLTYSWTKNGSPYPGSTASISFPSAQASNAGAYRLTATNASGSATAEFILTVVNSPWERWEWRRPGIPNAAITDIKVYDGEAFAVSATQLLRSTDGINWTKSVFPQGFTGNSIAKAGTRFICTGLDASGQFRVATSTNQAATWSISIPSGFAAPFMPEKFSLIAHKGAFIAYDSTTGLSLGTFLHSTDGISWTRLMASDLSGATVELTGSGSIASDGETLILASNTSNIQGPARHFRSTDGTTWQEFETIPAATALGGHATTAFHDGERFYLFHPSAIYSSADGLTWTHHPSPGNGFIENSMLAATADHVIAFSPQFPTFRFFSDPVAIDSRNIYPTESHSFTAAASFGNKVLYGTDKGFLGLASGPYEVRIPREKSSIVASIEFTENLFIARNDNTFNFANSEADYLSGDGVTWKRSQSLNTPVVQITGSAAGRYFGVPDFGSGIYSGHNPFDVRLNPADPIGLSPNITFIGQLPNGNSIAVVSTEMGTSALFSRVNGATTWFQASFPLSLDSTSRFASLGNRWFSNVGSPNSALIRTSTNGTTWNSTGLTGSNPHFVTFGGRSWCIFTNSSSAIRAANSTNGTTWSNLATSGLPGSGFEVKRVVTFGTFLVLLGNDENLYFSENGTQWLRGFTPGKVVDLASGNGQLVAVMKNGGIIQTGTPHLGGNAPLVSILSPQTASTHLIGSRITIEGTLSDPEDGAASYECFVDSQLVASGSGTSFRFPVHITDPAGHTVTVRVRDSSGLRQMDAIRLRSAPAEPENLLENTPSGTIPAEHSVNFDDVFYVAGRRSVHRSLDGRTWEKMPIPSFANSIHGMASGNGTLVIQFDDGGIMSTRDGINWTEFQPNITQYWVREPIRFSSGVFIASYQTQGSNTGSVMTSADGLVWETGTVSAEGHLGWIAISPRGTILGGMVSGQGIFRSVDGGYNWAPVLGSTSRNSHGIFAEGRFLVARAEAGARGFFISSTEEAMEWTEHPLPSGILDAPILAYLGGNYFLGTRGIYTHASSDALAWQPLSTGISKELLSHARGLFLAKAPDGRVVTSRDGLNWQASQGIPVSVARILTNDEFYLVIGSDGSMWRSRDGEEWEMTLAGSSSPPNANKTGLSMAELHGTLIVAGSRILVCSQDEGRTWSHVNINGSPAESNSLFAKVVSSGSEVMVFEGSTSSNTLLHRSINGSEFQTVTGLPAKTWADLAWNGSEWMLLASDGSLYRSINGGSTWTQLNTTGMLRGAALVWFNHRWVIIGAAIAGVNTPYVGFTLGEGDLLQNHGTIGFGNSIGPVRTVVAHGTLLIWTRGERMFVSNNGTSWAAGTPFPLAANADYDIYHTSEGFVAFKGSTWSAEPVEAWSAGTSGLTWNPIPPPFNSIQYAENLGDRVFLFASGVISELHDKDLAITLPALAHVTLGVGDPINTQITITNLGRAIPPGGPWKVRAWLAKNRFYGDTKNIPLGTFDITAPMPAPGASQSYPVTFTLPNNILTGTNHLILQLSGPESVRETNTANNTIISDTAFVTIPEWEFSVATNGNGQVNRDFSAMRYPHKAQVSLTATAGKGAVFTGWAGDAFSPNNQITILMDGNKSVAANFSNRAHLQVFVLGKGEVTGLADLGSYPIGQTAQVTAVPDSSWVFSHWTGATHSSNASAAILMDAPKSITAHFVLPLATWKQSHFTAAQLANTAISGNEADFDHDGLTNWQEYLHGSDPTDTNSTGAGPVTLSDGFLRRTYTRNLGAESGASFACRGGRNLLSWDAADLQERILSNEDGVETIEAMLPMTGHQSGFLRFEYQDPPP